MCLEVLTPGKEAFLIDLLVSKASTPIRLREASAQHALAQLTQKELSSVGELECILADDETLCDALRAVSRASTVCHKMIKFTLVDSQSEVDAERTLTFVELAAFDKLTQDDQQVFSSGMSALTGIFKFLGKRQYMRSERLIKKRDRPLHYLEIDFVLWVASLDMRHGETARSLVGCKEVWKQLDASGCWPQSIRILR